MKSCSWKGCLIGCLSILGLCVVLAVLAGVWATRKGEFDVETSILDADSEIFIRAYLAPENQALITFFTNINNRVNAANQQNMPDFLRGFQRQTKENDVQDMLPLEIEGVFQTEPAEHRLAIGFSFYNNMVKLGFGIAKWGARQEGKLHEHAGREYLGDDGVDPAFFGLEENTLLIANSKEGMNAMMASFDRGPADHASDERFRGVDTNAPFYGFANGYRATAKLFELMTDQQISQDTVALIENETRRLGFHLVVNPEETLDLFFLLETNTVDDRVRQEIENALQNAFIGGELNIAVRVSTANEGYLGQVTISGFGDVAVQTH